MTSSASTPSTSSTGTASASSTWRISGSCERNRSGVSLRPALYVASFSLRNVGAAVSNATARWSGFSSPTTLISMDVKPYTALVTWPDEVAEIGRQARRRRGTPGNARRGAAACSSVSVRHAFALYARAWARLSASRTRGSNHSQCPHRSPGCEVRTVDRRGVRTRRPRAGTADHPDTPAPPGPRA